MPYVAVVLTEAGKIVVRLKGSDESLMEMTPEQATEIANLMLLGAKKADHLRDATKGIENDGEKRK